MSFLEPSLDSEASLEQRWRTAHIPGPALQSLTDLSVPPLMTGSHLHVNGSFSSKGTLVGSEHAKMNERCAAHTTSGSKDGYFHAVGSGHHRLANSNRHSKDQVRVGACGRIE